MGRPRRAPPNGEVEGRYRRSSFAELQADRVRYLELLEALEDDIEAGTEEWAYPDSTREYLRWHLMTIAEELAWRRANKVLRRHVEP
jgi:hypothetical protein